MQYRYNYHATLKTAENLINKAIEEAKFSDGEVHLYVSIDGKQIELTRAEKPIEFYNIEIYS